MMHPLTSHHLTQPRKIQICSKIPRPNPSKLNLQYTTYSIFKVITHHTHHHIEITYINQKEWRFKRRSWRTSRRERVFASSSVRRTYPIARLQTCWLRIHNCCGCRKLDCLRCLRLNVLIRRYVRFEPSDGTVGTRTRRIRRRFDRKYLKTVWISNKYMNILRVQKKRVYIFGVLNLLLI